VTSRFGILSLFLVGCGWHGFPAYIPPPQSAAMALAVHAEGMVETDKDPKVSGGADIGLDVTGCCSAGIYVSASSLSNKRAKEAAAVPSVTAANEAGSDATPNSDRSALEVLDGGAEVGVVIPGLENRFRLRARAGLSGTAPRAPSSGRSGFSTSVVLVTRLWKATPPAPNQFSPDIDLLFGYSVLSLGRERTSAGQIGERFPDRAFMLGLRLGTDFGLALE
jgi:hypothetical protein